MIELDDRESVKRVCKLEKSTASPLEGNKVLAQISELQATNIPAVTISRLCER